MLAKFSAASMSGFMILAVSPGGADNASHVYFASAFFALQYGFGDTVAYISIRLIVGQVRFCI